jgi:beta-carotene hydroxylase
MSQLRLPLDRLPAEQRAALQQLTRTRGLAWPTVALWAVLTLTYLSVYTLAGLGQMPLALGLLLNTVVGYVAFSVAHDAIHRAIAEDRRLNDLIGQLGVLLVVPYVDLRLFRWGHSLHHRHTSDAADPDRVFHGRGWTLPLRWMFIDLAYFRHAVRHGDATSAPFLRRSILMALLTVAVILVLTAAGFGRELLMLWFIPSRLIQLALGFSFFWLPHVPHTVSQAENFTRATTVRFGGERWLGPLLQGQHYHLVHHLFPTTPFYNNEKVWRIIEPLLAGQDLAVQHGLAIQPVIYPAGQPRPVSPLGQEGGAAS